MRDSPKWWRYAKQFGVAPVPDSRQPANRGQAAARALWDLARREFGSDELKQPGMSVYGTTKRAVRYLTRSLVAEYRDTPLVIGTMSPGIVIQGTADPGSL